MSRSKRSAAKQRKAAAQRSATKHRLPAAGQAGVISVGETALSEQRLGSARRRGRWAKAALAAAATIGFCVWMLLARVTYAGHPKHPVRALSIPQPLYQVVRRNLLQAGIIAPATPPPDATTSTS
jgi:hypothetical protein